MTCTHFHDYIIYYNHENKLPPTYAFLSSESLICGRAIAPYANAKELGVVAYSFLQYTGQNYNINLESTSTITFQ
jgi:hypothetical protein